MGQWIKWKLSTFNFGSKSFQTLNRLGKASEEVFWIPMPHQIPCLTGKPMEVTSFSKVMAGWVQCPASPQAEGEQVACLLHCLYFSRTYLQRGFESLSFRLVFVPERGSSFFPKIQLLLLLLLFLALFLSSLSNTDYCVRMSQLLTMPACSLIIRALSPGAAAPLMGVGMEINEVLLPHLKAPENCIEHRN